MAWDPALLRKYTTTNHFKLLNQIRSELRDQPIQRPLITNRAAAAAASGRRAGRPAEPQASQSFSRRRGAAAAPAPLPVAQSVPAVEHHQPIVAVPVITDLVLPDAHTGG
jgi:hypothetical protein